MAPHLKFLNNTTSWVFVVVFVFLLFITTSIFWIGLSFVVAIAVATAARIYVPQINQVLPVPSNRAILITGCSTGIGYDAAIHFAKQGFTVFAGVRKPEDQEKLKSNFSGGSGVLIPVIIDVLDNKSINACVQTVTDALRSANKRLHAIVNNAGYSEGGVLELQPLDRIRTQLECNVVGQIAVAQAFLPLLREATRDDTANQYRPRIVWLSSGVGQMAFPSSGIYSASKHAIEAISESIDIELSHWGIRSTLVQPGAIKTEFSNTVKKTRTEALFEAKSSSDESVFQHYEQSIAKFAGRNPSYSTTEVVIDALTNALLDSKPLASYKAGNDVQISMPLGRLLPPNAVIRLMASKYFA